MSAENPAYASGVAGDDESPFARIPQPGIHETPSPMTPMGEVAAYGTMARGIRSRSRTAGRLVGVLFLLLILGSLLFGAIGWFLDDDSESTESPSVPSSITQTAPPGVPVAPPPTVPPAPG
jgi:hypothetical protein